MVGQANEQENGPWFNNGNVDARIRDNVAAHTLANSNRIPNYRPKTC